MSEELERGVMWGELMTGIESARQGLKLAQRGETLLNENDRDRLQAVMDTLRKIEQRAWAAMANESKKPRSRKR
ncbi:MAG TPA: hypothetical protein VFO62_10535 [Candidatus Binatia bacterium]|nr:hypothetical protein [Candidatus Binatia bacterium]